MDVSQIMTIFLLLWTFYRSDEAAAAAGDDVSSRETLFHLLHGYSFLFFPLWAPHPKLSHTSPLGAQD